MATTTHNTASRSPVIVVMGHIDHGKSTLLDYIRKTNVVEEEAGGITQHISAYEVTHADKNGAERQITFLDTPGHEAFQKMREHGAEVADIAILIVSAEDGVKPQTLEALASIKRIGIPFVVAINKIDKPNANIEKTKQELAEHEVYLEGYGGDVPVVAVSAKRGDGVSDLLELLLLVSDMAELTGKRDTPASGIVIEAHRDPKKGIATTLIIKDGSLKSGMCMASGRAISPVRIFENFLGQSIKEASFSSPVRVVGWSELPEVGEPFQAYASKKDAERAVATQAPEIRSSPKAASDDESGERVVIPIVLKADVAGTLDAIEHELQKLKSEGIELRLVLRGVGNISEGDIKLASGKTGALVVGFNTDVDSIARDLADRNDVPVHTFDIIYKLSEWLAEVIEERRPRKEIEEVAGRAKVLKTFSKAKQKQVLGARMEEGALATGNTVRIIRRDTEIGRGSIGNLQQNRTDAKRVESGEFGAEVKAAIDIMPGDMLETFVVKIH